MKIIPKKSTKKILFLSTLLICGNALAETCPDPKDFKFTPCQGRYCKYTLQTEEGWYPNNHSLDGKVDVFTNHFKFKEAHWGQPHTSYRMVCQYQDPERPGIMFALTILSHKSFKKTDFENHENWIGRDSYTCWESVQGCSFGNN